MLRDQLGLQVEPTVTAALAWLMPPAGKHTIRAVWARARISSLLQRRAGDGVRPDGPFATRLAIRALKTLPDDPVKLADILHGLGLMAAWSDASFTEPLIGRLKRRRINLEKVFARVLQHEGPNGRPLRTDTIAAAQWLSTAERGWETFSTALAYNERGEIGGASFRYGLAFTARIILILQPHVADALIRRHANQPRLAAIAEAALSLAFGFDDNPRPQALLSSRNVALVSIGASAVICAPAPWQTKRSVRDCNRVLVDGGLAPADAVWMLGWRMNATFREQQRCEWRQRGQSARLAQLERTPDAAFGGAQNAPSELARVQDEVSSIIAKMPGIRSQLEDDLDALASLWPAGGLSEDQLGWLDKSFAESPELCHRLATKLSHADNRQWLLRRNVARVKAYIGLDIGPEDRAASELGFLESAFRELAGWTAQSVHLLYAEDKRGAGRRTSDLVKALATEATGFVGRPFAAQRQPEKWELLVGRAALAARFALSVVAATPDASRDSIAGLADLSLTFARQMLGLTNIPVRHAGSFQRIATEAAFNLRFASNPRAVAASWIADTSLPAFIRALIVWSSADLFEEHRTVAASLFSGTCLLPLSSHSNNTRLDEMLSLLDIAVAAAGSSSRLEMSELIRSLWHDAYQPWVTIDARWTDTADMLCSAVATAGPDRDRLLAEPAFAASYCRHLIS